ncbi:MAG: DUF1176 domain-containing protein [Pseudomonadota bacterium]
MFRFGRVFLVLATVLAWSGAASAGPRKEVRDWYVWCDDELNCQMHTSNSENDIWSFGFERSRYANSEAILFLSSGLELLRGSSVIAVIDGDEKAGISLPLDGADFKEGVWRFPRQNANGQVLDAMMAGNKLQLVLQTDKGEKRVDVSLSGVTGGALFIDEAQDRLSRADALKAKGDGAPRDAVSRVTMLKTSTDLPKIVFDYWLNNTDFCADGGEEARDLIKEYGGISIAVEEGSKMFVIPCGLPGAYNFLHTVLILDEKENKVRTLPLPTMGQRGPSVTETAYNTNWDDRKSTLTSFYKGRGLGDCGASNVWYWEGGYYSNFEMIEAYVKWECDGKHDDWPKVWPPD